MRYPVIVEHKNGVWRAFIPQLSDLGAEGESREEALRNAEKAAEAYLSEVDVATIEISMPGESTLRPDSPQAVLMASGMFVEDENAMLEHIQEIYSNRQKQRDDADREAALPGD
jgi:predicted RNase H-like HicB family nuclease